MAALGDYVSQEFENLASVINQYDHYLFLEMVPVAEHENLVDKQKCFRIFDERTQTIVMYFSISESPQDILVKLWTADQDKNDPVALMEARNAAYEVLNNEKIIAQREAQKEFFAFVGKNQKSRWHHDGRVRDEHFNDMGPVRKHIT